MGSAFAGVNSQDFTAALVLNTLHKHYALRLLLQPPILCTDNRRQYVLNCNVFPVRSKFSALAETQQFNYGKWTLNISVTP